MIWFLDFEVLNGSKANYVCDLDFTSFIQLMFNKWILIGVKQDLNDRLMINTAGVFHEVEMMKNT